MHAFDIGLKVCLARLVWQCIACEATSDDSVPPALCTCGAVDSYACSVSSPTARAVPATAFLGQTRRRRPTGDADFDSLLSGGFVEGSTALIWGRPGCGKSRTTLRWATRLGPALCMHLEMPGDLTTQTAQSAGADLHALYLVDSYADFEAAARDCGARCILLDSISEVPNADAYDLLKYRLTPWAEKTGGVVLVICHQTKGGGYAGPSKIGHWPDYLLRLSPKGSGLSRVRVVKSRYCPLGVATVPIVAQVR